MSKLPFSIDLWIPDSGKGLRITEDSGSNLSAEELMWVMKGEQHPAEAEMDNEEKVGWKLIEKEGDCSSYSRWIGHVESNDLRHFAKMLLLALEESE